MLLTQLTALRDEQPALLSCLAFDRTLSYGVDLARRSLADLFAGFSTVRPFVMRAFFFRLQTEIFSRLCSVGYVLRTEPRPEYLPRVLPYKELL